MCYNFFAIFFFFRHFLLSFLSFIHIIIMYFTLEALIFFSYYPRLPTSNLNALAYFNVKHAFDDEQLTG